MPSFARHFGVQSQPTGLDIDELVQEIEEPLNDPRIVDEPPLTTDDFEEIEIEL